MRVGIVLAGAVVVVPVVDRLVWRQFLQPPFIVLVQAAFVVVDEYTGCDVHSIDEGQNRFSHIPLSPLFQPMPS